MKKTRKKSGSNSLKRLLIVYLIYAVIFVFFPQSILITLPIIVLYSIFWLFGTLSGRREARKDIKKEEKIIAESNPLIYYRELPNTYGIGINSILMDLTIENQKDLLAVILDLCAKKYLQLTKVDNKYVIKILKEDDNLLLNEKYVINYLKEGQKKFDFNKWYTICENDARELGLITSKSSYKDIPYESEEEAEITLNDIFKKARRIVFVLLLIFTPFYLLSQPNVISNFKNATESINELLLFIGSTIAMLLFVWYMISILLAAIMYRHHEVSNTFKIFAAKGYNEKIGSSLEKTPLGIENYYKLVSLKSFIKHFGDFASKAPEEVQLWDRYLSYAIMFDLTNNILDTGYKQLTNNGSFNIDHIEDFKLEETEVINTKSA